ncbi:MAG TPA: hypothetical protein VLA03_05980, partial [Draconibacterium sp.]|nr:hypothetical protein [Draconibacterium sp.]
KSNEIQPFPGSQENDTIDAEIVFAGYGFQNKETSYNDYEGLELKDKIVLIMTRNREIAIDTANIDYNTNLEMAKMARIFMSGAKQFY